MESQDTLGITSQENIEKKTWKPGILAGIGCSLWLMLCLAFSIGFIIFEVILSLDLSSRFNVNLVFYILSFLLSFGVIYFLASKKISILGREINLSWSSKRNLGALLFFGVVVSTIFLCGIVIFWESPENEPADNTATTITQADDNIDLTATSKTPIPSSTIIPKSSNSPTTTGTPGPTNTITPTSTDTLFVDSLSMMEAVFDGNYSREEIREQLDLALELYGEEISEENYSRAGSVLVSLKNEYGVPEMDILDYMIRSYVEGVNINFAAMAALAAAFIAAGDN